MISRLCMALALIKRCKYISVTIIFIYLLFSLYSSYKLLSERSSDIQTPLKNIYKDVIFKENLVDLHKDNGSITINNMYAGQYLNGNPVVEIWGKAAIGHYLWEHILGGSLKTGNTNLIRHGRLQLQGIQLRTGPGIVQGYVPTDVQFLILVLNGRDHKKIAFAKTWLDYLDHLPLLTGAALFLLGDEKCNNDWLLPYMAFQGGKVKFAFLTYDSPLIDNVHFYQWPLGVATYRNFPKFEPSGISTQSAHAHLCNFFGTAYPGSSRHTLVNFLRRNTSLNCTIKSRQTWMPSESEETMAAYVTILKDSTLTLSPIGANSESYRIYEALSCGSIPVVENIMSEGNCGGAQKHAPYRLLKAYRAPLLYVTNWEIDLPPLLMKHKNLPFEEKMKLHQHVLNWYHGFKIEMKQLFVDVVKLNLLNITA